MFATLQDELAHYQKLRVECLRKRGPGMVHPDLCPQLLIHGVEFAIPSMAQEMRPSFSEGQVEVHEVGGLDWPEIAEFRATIGDNREDASLCPECGQPLGGVCEMTPPVLKAALTLAAKALRVQYELSDDQLGDLLAFRGGIPLWLIQLMNWSVGLDPNGTGEPDSQAVGEFAEAPTEAPTEESPEGESDG